MKKNLNVKGYTLIELLVVIGLIAIVSAIVIPKIDRNFGYVDSYAKELVYDIRYIRENAMEGKANCSIKFNFGSGELGSYEVEIEGAVVETSKLKSGFEIKHISGSSGKITFRADGVINTGSQVVEISGNGESKEITINGMGNISTD